MLRITSKTTRKVIPQARFLENVSGTPVLQIEYVNEKIKYIQIERLRDLIDSTNSEIMKKHIHNAGRYADLVLGKNWRN